MTCPHLDGELENHSIPTTGGQTFSYYSCPTCQGKWLETFDANYIKGSDIADEEAGVKEPLKAPRRCPVCQKFLGRVTGETIPPDVLAFRCPTGHGYFFPKGELAKFKAAQEVKLEYHKRWQIPISSLAVTLLTGIFGVVLSVGLVIGVIEGQRVQTTRSQAKAVIVSQNTYISGQSVIISATTSEDLSLTVSVSGPQNLTQQMITTDNRTHLVTLLNLTPGTYTYVFSFVKAGNTVTSDTYSFTIPSGSSPTL